MLLAYNASEADIAAYPGKFKPDTANPTGLFVPRLNGLFARYCAGEGAGWYNAPGVPNITGEMFGVRRIDQIKNESANSAIDWNSYDTSVVINQTAAKTPADISFKASRSNRVYGSSTTVMPPSANLPVALYLGIHAEV